MNDKKYMLLALKEAQKAYNNQDVPVGCVIVLNDKVIAKAHNTRHLKNNTMGHAEIEAIKKACKKLNTWILEDATIYVTLEPCLMCAGAILNARIKRLVYATQEPKFGAIESVISVFDNNKFNHTIEIEKNILKEESTKLLKSFFQELRSKKELTK